MCVWVCVETTNQPSIQFLFLIIVLIRFASELQSILANFGTLLTCSQLIAGRNIVYKKHSRSNSKHWKIQSSIKLKLKLRSNLEYPFTAHVSCGELQGVLLLPLLRQKKKCSKKKVWTSWVNLVAGGRVTVDAKCYLGLHLQTLANGQIQIALASGQTCQPHWPRLIRSLFPQNCIELHCQKCCFYNVRKP